MQIYILVQHVYKIWLKSVNQCGRRCANEKVGLTFTEFKVIRGYNSGNTCRMTFISLNANLHISTSMCSKFGEHLSSGVGDALKRRWTLDLQSLVIRVHNSKNTCRMTFISLHANLYISTSMCKKFGENPSSTVGGDALRGPEIYTVQSDQGP